jgi:putative tricarboxylic transport membrane protein
MLMVSAAVAVFAYSIQTLGLVLATVLITMIGGFASPQVRVLEMVAVAMLLTVMATAIFIWGIGLPIPIWPEL